jgi:GPH family glycoside/pentoside/hexuronide:cation symporter
MPKQHSEEQLPRLTKVLYGAGDLGFSMNNSIMGILFGVFLTKVVGLQPAMAAIAVFTGRAWDFINDPIIGYLSDRTRSRWGRRRPFLLFGFIPFALTFCALWWKPPITAPWALVAYYAFAYLLYDAAATFVYMPYYALTPELTLDYDERTTLTGYRMFFSILGGLMAFTLPQLVIGEKQPENADRALLMGIIFGFVGAIPLLFTFLGTRERPEFQQHTQPNLKESLRAAIRNRPFVFAMGIFFFTWGALEIVQNMLLFFLIDYLRIESETDQTIILGSIFGVALFTLPLWDRISRRWDKRIAYIVGMVFLSAVMIVMIVIKPGWGLPVIVGLAGLAGVGVGAMHVLPWAIIPDAVEWDQLKTGRRHEGIFYSLVALFRKIAAAIALPMALLVLDWSGYISEAPIQAPGAVRAIRLLTGVVPAICLCAGIVFAVFYPLSRERHVQVRAELASRRPAELPSTD